MSLFKNYHSKNNSFSENEKHVSKIKYDSKENIADKYNQNFTVIRRGTSFNLYYHQLDDELLQMKDMSLEISTVSNKIIISFKLSCIEPIKEGFKISISEIESNKQLLISITVDVNASIGLYSLCLKQNDHNITENMGFYIIFNPFHELDPVYCKEQSWTNEYLLSERIKIFCGSKDGHRAIPYTLNQYSLECVLVCAEFISRMEFKERSDPTLVARFFSALINGNDDSGLMYGNWGEIMSGKGPSSWTNAIEIYKEYLNTGKPVEWAQCFVFAMLFISMLRNIGIYCTPVTGFGIAHDNNCDGYVDIYLNAETLEVLKKSETRWNFHCWIMAYFKRKDLEFGHCLNNSSEARWQHLDGTPQERSQGIYQCGPYEIELLRNGVCNDVVPYDGKSVYYSLNSLTRYFFIGNDSKIVNQYEKKDSASLIVSTNHHGKKVDITSQYKLPKLSKPESSIQKITLGLDVVNTAPLGDSLKYTIDVNNVADGSPTILSLTLELHNQFGKNILKSNLHHKVFFFNESKAQFSGNTEVFNVEENVDLSMAVYHWDLRCHDQFTDKFKHLVKYTSVVPGITVLMSLTRYAFLPQNQCKVELKIKNGFSFDLGNCVFRLMHNKYTPLDLIKFDDFLPGSEKSYENMIHLKDSNLSRQQVFEVWVESKYCNAMLKKRKFFF